MIRSQKGLGEAAWQRFQVIILSMVLFFLQNSSLKLPLWDSGAVAFPRCLSWDAAASCRDLWHSETDVLQCVIFSPLLLVLGLSKLTCGTGLLILFSLLGGQKSIKEKAAVAKGVHNCRSGK